MDILQAQDLMSLAKAPKDKTCITIYLNLGVSSEERSNARLRILFLFKKIRHALEFRKDRANNEKILISLIEKSSDVIRNPPSDALGVVLFRSEGKLAVYFAKHAIEDHVAVSDSFHLKPLLNTMQGLSEYYAIVLNRHQVRFYEGNRTRVIPLGTVESSFLRWRNAATSQVEVLEMESRGQRVFELESKNDSHEEGVDAFFPRVAEEFKALVKDSNRPVILVGSAWLRQEFRRICPLQSLIGEEVSAILIFANEALIHQYTWPIAEREFDRRKGILLSLDKRHRSTMISSDDLSTIANASMTGRISKIMVSEDDRIFGRLNRADGFIEFYSPETCPYGDDILCDIAQEVLHHGGTAILLPRKEMPTDAPVAAAFRW